MKKLLVIVSVTAYKWRMMKNWTFELGDTLGRLMRGDLIFAGVRAVLTLSIGFVVIPVLRRAVARFMDHLWAQQQIILAQRIVTYACWIIVAMTALRELGFDLGVILGAAGVFSVAIGFASQTSFSNLISGLFLFSEQAFVIGNMINVGGTIGEVLSIDLLSVKLRTQDNLFVRIPNETMLKSVVINLSRFPIRRLDMEIGVGYNADLMDVRSVLMHTAEKNLLVLDDPKPLFVITGYGESTVNILFSVWSKRENFIELKNSMYHDIKVSFQREKISQPFPHRVLIVGDDDYHNLPQLKRNNTEEQSKVV